MPATETITRSICSLCLKCCGINAHVEDGRLVKVSGLKEHPYNRLCVKASATADWLYSPERITSPLKKSGGGWQPISWANALDEISAKLLDLREKYGPKSLVINLGNPFIGSHVPSVAKRFCSVYGTPNYTSGASLCFVARAIGHGLTLSNRMLPLFPSLEGTQCVIVWGLNPRESDINIAAEITAARKNGAKVIVIDPRRIPLAKQADVYAAIKPGTDSLLALGLLHVIIGEELYDREFVENWTSGFDELKQRIAEYTPEMIEKYTWVPADTVRRIARLYAGAGPATIAQGVSLEHCPAGVETSQLIAVLVAITGNLDITGGNTYNLPLTQTSLRLRGRVSIEDAIGRDYPIFGRFTTETTSIVTAESATGEKAYPVKSMILQGSNPLLTWPNTGKLKKMLENLELLVVSDLYLTGTAELADYFLPAASFYEEDILKDYTMVGLPLISHAPRAIEPRGECLEDWRLWAELGKRIGTETDFPWNSSDEFFEMLLEPSGLSLQQVKDASPGVFFHQLGDKDYLKSGFRTASGKIEVFPRILAEAGYSPLPSLDSPENNLPEEDEEFPLVLTSGPRVLAYTHSRFRNIDRLKKLQPEPLAEINRRLAAESGISDGEMILIESRQGSLRLKARLTEDIHPSVVSIPHGWNQANANLLTDDRQLDPISAYPSYKTARCRISRAPDDE